MVCSGGKEVSIWAEFCVRRAALWRDFGKIGRTGCDWADILKFILRALHDKDVTVCLFPFYSRT